MNAQKYIVVHSKSGEIVFALNGSDASECLYNQLTLTVDIEKYGDSEKIFYPKQRLSTENTPMSDGLAGRLGYYAPWGNVVMFIKDFGPANGLFHLGEAVSGPENISRLKGVTTISRCDREGHVI